MMKEPAGLRKERDAEIPEFCPEEEPEPRTSHTMPMQVRAKVNPMPFARPVHGGFGHGVLVGKRLRAPPK